jgi:hypothetical protein
MFDALRIEAAFRNFFRGPPHDSLYEADVFRAGDPERLGKLLDAFSKRLARRIEFLEFVPDEALPGGAQDQLNACIEAFAAAAEALKRRRQYEREDYRWLIIGDLVRSITALLDHMEGRVLPP